MNKSEGVRIIDAGGILEVLRAKADVALRKGDLRAEAALRYAVGLIESAPDLAGDDTPGRLPVREVFEEYNRICVSLSRAEVLSAGRRRAIAARLHTIGYEKVIEAFRRVEASDFLRGANPKNFRANLDWILKEGNMAKILSGNYENKRSTDTIEASSFDTEDVYEAAMAKTYGGKL